MKKNFKKLVSVILVFVMIMGIVGCTSKPAEADPIENDQLISEDEEKTDLLDFKKLDFNNSNNIQFIDYLIATQNVKGIEAIIDRFKEFYAVKAKGNPEILPEDELMLAYVAMQFYGLIYTTPMNVYEDMIDCHFIDENETIYQIHIREFYETYLQNIVTGRKAISSYPYDLLSIHRDGMFMSTKEGAKDSYYMDLYPAIETYRKIDERFMNSILTDVNGNEALASDMVAEAKKYSSLNRFTLDEFRKLLRETENGYGLFNENNYLCYFVTGRVDYLIDPITLGYKHMTLEDYYDNYGGGWDDDWEGV